MLRHTMAISVIISLTRCDWVSRGRWSVVESVEDGSDVIDGKDAELWCTKEQQTIRKTEKCSQHCSSNDEGIDLVGRVGAVDELT